MSVVGWLDYRSLPWIPMFAVMTFVVGAVLWIRKPRPQRWSRRGPEDDAVPPPAGRPRGDEAAGREPEGSRHEGARAPCGTVASRYGRSGNPSRG